MINQPGYTGKKFLSRIPDTDTPTRVLLDLASNIRYHDAYLVLFPIILLIYLPAQSGWKVGGFSGALKEFIEINGYLFPFQFLIILPILLWHHNRNYGAYFFKESVVKGSRISRNWILSWKSAPYSDIADVSYDSERRRIEFARSDSRSLMRMSNLDESEEQKLWPLIETKIGVGKLDFAASRRSAELRDEVEINFGWKGKLAKFAFIIVVVAIFLWGINS